MGGNGKWVFYLFIVKLTSLFFWQDFRAMDGVLSDCVVYFDPVCRLRGKAGLRRLFCCSEYPVWYFLFLLWEFSRDELGGT